MNDLDFMSGEKLRRSLLSRAGIITVLLVVALNIAYRFMTDVSIEWKSVLNLTTDCIIYLMSVYITFCAMADTSRRDAKGKEKYQLAMSSCTDAISGAMPHRRLLSQYCALGASNELADRRRETVEPYGIPYETYLSLSKKKARELRACGLTKRQKRAVRKADRMKPCTVCADSLCVAEPHGKRHPLPPSPASQLMRRYTASLFPTTLFAIFSAQIVFAVQGNTDIKAVFVECLLRVGLLCYTALRGYITGEKTVLCDTVDYLEAKSLFLHEFIEWVKSEENAKNPA